MSEQIEIFDQKRKKYRGDTIIGSIIFFIAWVIRSIIQIFELEMVTFHTIVFIILLLAICYQAFFAVKLNLIEKKIKSNPALNEALHNELVRLNELKAWKVAFFSVILFIVLVGILALTVKIDDTMLIVLTALLVGFGSYNTTVYVLDN
ncbi:hypothetical protein JW935_15960 [candidate division KSB1 bacterium]|nr:hypothetical protein [candidate division KSB1 bacterium]